MTIHRTAFVSSNAIVDDTAEIGPNAVIDGPVRIGPQCQIGPSVVVLGETEIGAGTVIHSNAVIGDVPQVRSYDGAASRCLIGQHCIIREGVTIHRATRDREATTIGDRCYLMTNSHVAHDCNLADDVTLVSGALLGGHVQVGRGAIVAGNSGVHQFVRIGELAMVGAVAMICQDIPPFMLTNHTGEIVGLNVVGLRRAGVGPEERQQLKSIFKLVYRSGLMFDQSVELADTMATFPKSRVLIDFYLADSRRGLRRFAGGIQRAA